MHEIKKQLYKTEFQIPYFIEYEFFAMCGESELEFSSNGF